MIHNENFDLELAIHKNAYTDNSCLFTTAPASNCSSHSSPVLLFMVIICTFAPRLVSRVASLPVGASHLCELASWSLFQAFCQISTNNANMPRSLALADGMYGFLSNLHPHHIGLNVLFHHTKLTTSRAFCCGISYESWHQWFSYSTFSHTAAGPCAPEMACMVKRKSFGYHPM